MSNGFFKFMVLLGIIVLVWNQSIIGKSLVSLHERVVIIESSCLEGE